MVRTTLWLAMLGIFCLAGPSLAQQATGKRVALVVGNGAYERPEDALPNPPNDARDMAAKLEELGFEVIAAIDQDFRGMRTALRQFDRALQGAQAGLFFYAGHGMEYRGRNYLFPTDAVLETPGDVGIGLIDVSQVMEVMETTVPTRLLFLDACRNNPLARRFRSALGASRSAAVGTGLARMDAAVGTYIAYATAPGDVAADGDGNNSPFTEAMLTHLDEPGLEVGQLMRKVRDTVLSATNEQQVPWDSSSLRGAPVILNLNLNIEVAPPAPAPAATVSPANTLWAAIQGSTRASEWRYFAETYPDDPRANLALLRAEAFEADAVETETEVAALPPVVPEPEPPVPDPASIEAALSLIRDDWRRVQSSLQALGFDPRGVDGSPGANTRAALGSWQRGQSFEVTGFLDEGQYARLLAEAEPKLAALEAARPEPPKPEPVQPAVGVFRQYQPGDTFKDCDDCPAMVVVPSGSFMMGSPAGEKGRFDNEGPQHRVTIGKPLAVGIHEVTRGQFRRFIEATNYAMGDKCWTFEDVKAEERSGRHWLRPSFSQNDTHPVVCVSHKDASAYLAWLTQETGESYRLLSEAEWEYVARGGTTTRRFWGDDAAENQVCRYANGHDATSKRVNGFEWVVLACDEDYAQTAPVGSFGDNGFGLHDVIGNVWEWVDDCYNDSYQGAPSNGTVWKSGDCSRRVLRGGSWFSDPSYLRSAFRAGYDADNRGSGIGFRVARTLR